MGKHSFEYLLIEILVLLLGASLNFFVVSLNDMQMPTSLQYAEDCFTLVDSEGNLLEITPETDISLPPGRVFMTSATWLKILGDIIHIENLVFDGYYSAGDILIEFGALSVIFWVVTGFLTWIGVINPGTAPFRNKATTFKLRYL